MADYANPDILVSTDWVDQNKSSANVRIIEVDVDTAAYQEGHVEGALAWNWQTQLCDPVRRDVIQQDALESLLNNAGVTPESTIVLYGDNNNWFACWALWQLQMFGVNNVKLMNGGRKKWIAEGRALSTETPKVTPTSVTVSKVDNGTRSFLNEVREVHVSDQYALVDVRSPDEYSGKILAPPGLPETCQRGGHIPGAKNIPWGKNCNEDGTFKSAGELRNMYDAAGVTAGKSVIAYCRIGERSSLTWFVLKHLLGFDSARNYDGSWTEWGNLVNAPVKQGPDA